jgi:hypothetical protein
VNANPIASTHRLASAAREKRRRSRLANRIIAKSPTIVNTTLDRTSAARGRSRSERWSANA